MMAVLSLSTAGAFALTPGDLLVVDPGVGTNTLFRVDPVTGGREVLSDFGDGANRGGSPIGVAVEADGRIVVIDLSVGSNGALYRVDPVSGERSLLSDKGS